VMLAAIQKIIEQLFVPISKSTNFSSEIKIDRWLFFH
jgi:hypothetical protein